MAGRQGSTRTYCPFLPLSGVHHRAHKGERRVLPSVWYPEISETREEESLLRVYHLLPPAGKNQQLPQKEGTEHPGNPTGPSTHHLSRIRRQMLSTSPARPQVQKARLWGMKYNHIIGTLKTNHRYKSSRQGFWKTLV